MKTNDHAELQSVFYLTLARAFLAPQEVATFAAFKQFLVEDLAELNDVLDYPIIEELASLQHELAGIPDHGALLGAYSALFLDPGSRIPINAGVYIDGAMMGDTVARIEVCFRARGLEKVDGFPDLADHVAVQLEFVAHLFELAAEAPEMQAAADMQASDFLHIFVAAWAPRLVAEIAEAGQRLGLAANPYLPLARIVEAVAEIDAAGVSPQYAMRRQQTAIEKARIRRASAGISDEDMAIIELKLREQGLSTDHLRIPLEGRDSAMGMTRAVPPEPRRKM